MKAESFSWEFDYLKIYAVRKAIWPLCDYLLLTLFHLLGIIAS